MYKLTDKQLSELVLLLSVPQIAEMFPRYTPTERTIYRRLNRNGISRPDKARRAYRTSLLLDAPPNLTDREALVLINKNIQDRVEDFRVLVEIDAEDSRTRFSQ